MLSRSIVRMLSVPNKLGFLPTSSGNVSSLRNLAVFCNTEGFNVLTSSQNIAFRTISTTTSFQAKIKDHGDNRPTMSGASMMASLRYKGRVLPKKKRLVPGKDAWSVVGYATADSYDLFTLAARLHDQGLYEVVPLEEELASVCLCVTAKYNVDDEDKLAGFGKDIYFFEDGTVVFWNIPELERDSVLMMLRKSVKVEKDPYEEDDIFEESEMMNVGIVETVSNGGDPKKSTHLDSKGIIRLSAAGFTSHQCREHSLLLEQYAFSNAIASSVKLGMLEASLDKLIDSIEFLSDDLKAGRDVKMSQSEVLKKSGEIFALRHVVNLSSDLLDTPDFYWDRENLESLYHVTCSHLAIGKRTRVMNEKLTHLCELMELIRTHLSDKHHVRLEWFIIALIWVEVIFELIHFAERFV